MKWFGWFRRTRKLDGATEARAAQVEASAALAKAQTFGYRARSAAAAAHAAARRTDRFADEMTRAMRLRGSS